MTTLREAAQRLGVSMTTLEKWCKRLGIEPKRHPQDWRFRVLSDEQIEQIRQERALMPAPQAVISSYNSLAFDRRSAASGNEGIANDATAPLSPAPRLRQPQRRASSRAPSAEGLPAGMMSKKDAARLHGIARSTIENWCQAGKVDTSPETFQPPHGHWPIVRPLTRRGLAQFYALAKGHADFTACPDCPHEARQQQQIAEGS